MNEEGNVLQSASESTETEKPAVYKFPLPDGRTVEMSSDMSGDDQMCAFQQIINAYLPMPSLLDPKVEALAWTKAYLKRMGELHSIAVVAYTEPARSADGLTANAVHNVISKANLDEADPRLRNAFQAIIDHQAWGHRGTM
jgi:hypothetical protein